MSVSELKNITPGRLIDLLDIDKIEMKEFADYLHEKKVLTYKFDFKCDVCGGNCTAYERILKKQTYKCKNCDAEISNSTILEHSWITYNIDKFETIELEEENNVDLVAGTLNENKVIKLVDKGGERMKKVFIGSSKEAIKEMERIAIFLEEFDCEVITWNNPKTFVAGDFTLESLVDISNIVDAAIFVFNGEDETWYRDSIVKSVRDNVLLEYGLFLGAKGRKNSIFMCKNKPKIATDLLGVNYLDGEKRDFSLKRDVEVWLNRLN
jgi:predicted nucleotide-binding protein